MSQVQNAEGASSVPVTSTGIPIRNLWYMLLYAWNESRLTHRWRAEVDAAPTLDALLADILAKSLQQRLRIGLGRDYVDEHATIRGIRGRIDFSRSLRQMAFQHGRAHCHFHQFSPNTTANQIIRTTLSRSAQIGMFGPTCDATVELRQRLRRLVQELDMIDLIELSPDRIRREQCLQHDADYRLMLTICYLVLQRQMPTETAGLEDLVGLDRDAMTLWRLFERFVANFYRLHLTGWEVSAQAKLSWPADGPSDYVPAMNPDVLLEHKMSGTIVVLDTKFTAKSLVVGQWDKPTFNRDHLFQIYAYLRTQEHISAKYRESTGILLYPTTKHKLSETIVVQGHRIRWETIDLAQPWEEIEQNLLEVIQVEVQTSAGKR